MKKLLTFFFSIFFFILLNAQPWTYDFGTTTGSYTTASGVSTTLLSSTPTNGGTYRVRCATTGNLGTGHVLANPGTSLGSGTELQINASVSSSTNKFSVYGWSGGAAVGYLKFQLRTTSSGNGALAIELGSGAASTVYQNGSSYTFGYDESLAILLINYSSGAIASVQRRINNSFTSISSSGISKDGNNIIEIYGNNTASSTSYLKNGTSYSLNTQSWDLWVDNNKISSSGGFATAGTLAAGTAINGFGFFAESSTSNAAFMYLDDLKYSNDVVLSADFLSFSCKNNNKTSSLIWEVANEKDNNYYEVEHSIDAKTFQAIGQVKGQGTTNEKQNYSFEHLTPSVGINYYRLHQVDFDGKETFSKTVSVLSSKNDKLQVYPNPVKDKLTINTDGNAGQTYSILNLLGQSVQTGKINEQNELNVNELSTGTYFLKVGSEAVKFVKN